MMSISPEKLASATALRTISHAGKEKQPCIRMADLCRPGLQFAGYFDIFAFERPQVIGKTEMAYLDNLPEDVRCERLERYFSYDIPCIIIARKMKCPPELLRQARKNGVPVYGSDEETSLFSAKAITYLSEALAPRQTCHGVLLDVFGVGLMITGESGVGKSECALELIKHGHQLVADDVVDISRVGRALFGESPEMVRDFMELRGVGIINARRIFGMGSVKMTEKVDMVISLEPWEKTKVYDRMGMTDEYMEILGNKVPSLTIPVKTGRNLAVIIEVAAMNNRQKKMGYNAAQELLRQLGMVDDLPPETIKKDTSDEY